MRANPLRALWRTGYATLFAGLAACSTSDVGSPCNHGPTEPQESLTVTFPAVACAELLCIFAERNEPPSTACQDDTDCNTQSGDTPFVCDAGECKVDAQHILERSMCSQVCSEDIDCAGGDPETSCKTGFACVPPQELGPFCCQKMCVCKDELDIIGARNRAQECEAGVHGCCMGEDPPAGCGPG